MNKKQRIVDARMWYERACKYDKKEFERKAEPCYGKVYKLGGGSCRERTRPGFFVGYGSTLRNNRKLKKSAEILSEGI